MDDKKFEIEFEDDFDSWLEQHDREIARKKQEAAKPATPPKQQAVTESPNVQKSVKRPAPRKTPGMSSPVPRTPSGMGSSAPRNPSGMGNPEPSKTPGVSSQPASASSGTMKDIPISRRDAVKNFRLDIDESYINAPVQESTDEPRKQDKSIYFANRQPSKAQLEHRREQEKALQVQQKQEKLTMQQQRIKERKQILRLRRILVATIIVFVSALCSIYCISCINDVLALDRSDEEIISVTVEKGATCSDIIGVLGDNKLINHEWFCKLLTKLRGFDKKTYLNGLYYLTPSMGVEGMLNEMRDNQTSDETIRLYFPEGWTIPQIVAKLDENKVCPAEYIYAALREVDFEYGFVSNIPKTDGRYFTLEGYIFPDTYDFFISDKANGIGENPNSIIRKFLGNYETKWTEIYDKRAKELGLTMDEVITIASIIQKEAADDQQMTKVSSVIHNRLSKPADFPTLGCDSTKKYVTNYLAKVIGTANASTYNNFYDTNSTRSGLPIGPICNPGIAAIEAALNPDDTDYYYFCHNEKGKIYLAKTYSEFQANWAQVLKDNEGVSDDNA